MQQVIDGSIVEVGQFVTLLVALADAKNEVGKPAWGRIGENIAIGHLQSCLIGFDDDSCDNKRRSSEVEEAVVGSHTLNTENLGEDIGESLFCIVGRGFVGTTRGQFRLRQRLHIGLAVRREGHLL